MMHCGNGREVSIEDIESAAGESPEDVKTDTVNGGNQSEAEETVEGSQDNRNLDKLPIEELLGYDDCGDIVLV